MARNDVRFILTAEDGKAIQQAQKLLEEVRKTGDEYDKLGNKQRNSQRGFNEEFGETILKLGKGLASMEAFSVVLDTVKDKISAINAEMSRTGSTSSSYMQAFSKLNAATPDASEAGMQQMDAFLRSLASRSGIGDQGLIRLTDAATGLARSPISSAQREDVLQQTAKMMELSPGADATGMAKGMASIVGASGGQINAGAASNIIMSMGGRVGDLGQRAGMLGQLRATSSAEGANLSMTEMAALSGFVSEAIGDGDGGPTVAVIKRMTAKLMNDPSKVEERTGPLTGNLIDRIERILNANEAGLLFTEEDMADVTGLAKGPDAKLALRKLMSPGAALKLKHRTSALGYAGMMDEDLVGNGIAIRNAVVPGGEAMHETELIHSNITAQRAGDTGMINRQNMLQAMDALYERGGKTEAFRGFFKQAFTGLAGVPYTEEERAARAEQIAGEATVLSKIPVVGGLLSRTAMAGAALEGAVGNRAMGTNGEEIKEAIRSGFRDASNRIPQRALPAGVHR